MKLDPRKRYLIARPRGGFNDQMVQLERCAVYAQEKQRVLIVDLSRSGVRMQFDAIFSFKTDFGPEAYSWTPAMAEVFDAAKSVFPSELKGQAGSHPSRFHRETGQFAVPEVGVALNFDFSRDYHEQVLVYEQSSGGRLSIRALKRIKLRPEVANKVIARLLKLGRRYDAVHIRHSDYKTDFDAYLEQMCPVFEHRTVLICSDSSAAKKAASEILSDTTTVISVSDIPDTGGKPLHQSSDVDVFDACIDFLSDLIALSRADYLFFPKLKKVRVRQPDFSSFSVLAEMLRRNPKIVRDLLADADPALLRQFLADASSEKASTSAYHAAAHLEMQDQLRSTMEAVKIAEGDVYIAPSEKAKKLVSQVVFPPKAPRKPKREKKRKRRLHHRLRRKLRSVLRKISGLQRPNTIK